MPRVKAATDGGVKYRLHFGVDIDDCGARSWLKDPPMEDVSRALGDDDLFGVEQEAHYKLLSAGREAELASGEAACEGTPLDVLAVSDVKTVARRSKLRKALEAAAELVDKRGSHAATPQQDPLQVCVCVCGVWVCARANRNPGRGWGGGGA